MTKQIVCVILALSSFGLLWAADIFTGTWKLDPAKSTFMKGKEAKELTATVTEQGDVNTITVKGTDAKGKAISVRYTVPIKGGTINYTEGGPVDGTTVASKRVNDKTIDSTATLKGKQVGTTHVVMSADGKSLTVTSSGVDEKGNAMKSVEVFHRQ